MARTTTKKTVEEKEVIEEVKEEVKVEKKVEKKKREFNDDDYILCRSVVPGELIIDGGDGRQYRFRDYDSEFEIMYRDLVNMVRRRTANITIPRIIIMDEDFIEQWPQVKETYDEVFSAGNITEILLLPTDQMILALSKLPKEIQKSAKSLVASMIDDGTIDSVSKIRALAEFFGVDFVLLSELFA